MIKKNINLQLDAGAEIVMIFDSGLNDMQSDIKNDLNWLKTENDQTTETNKRLIFNKLFKEKITELASKNFSLYNKLQNEETKQIIKNARALGFCRNQEKEKDPLVQQNL